MKHKHYEMIVAKAANMELVVFANSGDGEWFEMNEEEVPIISDFDFFLCLPQHKDACLHWLNGGVSQVEYTKSPYTYWCDIESEEVKWSLDNVFMSELLKIKVKPKKEKRWIAVDASTSQCTRHYSTKESCFNSEFAGCEGNASGWQFIEIEVEV